MPVEVKTNPGIRLLRESVRLPRAARRSIARYGHAAFRRIERRLFATEGASGGRPWKPLKTSTRLQKEAAGFPLDILVRTRRLKRSLTTPSSRDKIARMVKRRGHWVLELGTRTPWAIHHFRRYRSRPARPPIQLTRKDVDEIKDAVLRGLKPEIKKAIKVLQSWRPV